MKNQSKNKKIIIGVIALIVAISLALVGYNLLKPEVKTGAKAVEIVVVAEDESEETYKVQTDAEYLQEAMDEAEGLTYAGEEGEYGLMIDTVNDEKASFEENGAYWSFYVNDEYCNYGISEQPVADGDVFKIVYTIDE
ncbi:uncharacterized protein YxeA [Lachnospiraceae bacterium PM6-15]|uniref:DUF4430 domain-containing protein n=1 Tax=Ohessyouella blattaphilus TaxID=2949333 RepID=UPI003E2261D2